MFFMPQKFWGFFFGGRNMVLMNERYLKPGEAAKMLDSTIGCLASFRHQKKGPPYCRWGTVGVRYPLSKLLAYMAERTVEPSAPK